MRKILLIIFLLLLISCSTQAVEDTATPMPTATLLPREKPSDFQVSYYWETGSLPPPYFYSYTITIGPSAEGTITFEPGYSTYDPPTWVEDFQLSESDLDLLYEELYDANVFEGEWHQKEDIPVGGSADKMAVIAYGRDYSIPIYVEGEEKSKSIKKVYEEIETLVPQEIWDKLNEQHDEYVLEHEDEE